MRSDAVFKFDTTFDVYEQVYTQDPISGEFVGTFVFLKSDRGILVPGTQGNVYLATREGIPIYAAIRNVADKNGIKPFSVTGTEYDMFVNEANAQYDALGSFVGWRHLIRRTLPRVAGTVTHGG